MILESFQILIVDDDENICKLLHYYLKDLKIPCQIQNASNGSEAMSSLAENRFDLLICDLNLPDIDGIELMDFAKKQDKHTQVIIITGNSSVDSAVETMQKGAFDYLVKPIDQEEILIKVRNALDKVKLNRLLLKQQTRLDQHYRMLTRDLALAKQIQATLVPEYFEHDRMTAAVRYRPMMGLGGDFADIFYDPHHEKVYLTIIDVTGHGVAAALTVNRICTELLKLVRSNIEPYEIVTYLNRFFCHYFDKTAMYLTIMSTLVDLRQNILTHCGGAHPACILLHEDKETDWLTSQNMIIGYSEEMEFKQSKLDIAPGDKLVLYTDGLIEVENQRNNVFGRQRLARWLRTSRHLPAVKMADELIEVIQTFSQKPPKDDVLVLISDFF